jgi:chemotaxis protein histidine kinase CheA
MRILRSNLVMGVILSAMLSSTAFANSLANVISGHLNDANKLVDTFNKSLEDGDSLLVRIQDATDGKNAAVYQELRALSDGLNQRFKDNSVTLVKFLLLKDSDCALALADTSKSVESQNAVDACYELTDALGAATDARGATAQGLDAINNALSIYVTVLEELDAAAAKAQEEKDAAEAKAQLEAERAAAELKAKQEAEAAAELKAKQAAAAKAAAAKAAAAKAAAAKAAAAKAAALKKTTITCVKGKLTKKVTAVKPVCPAGYKKK